MSCLPSWFLNYKDAIFKCIFDCIYTWRKKGRYGMKII